MSISINVTPAASGGTFTVGSTSSQNVTLEVTGGIGPPGTDVALAAGTGISIVTVNNTATISSTVEAAANLADLGDVTLGNVTTGQVLAYDGTVWTASETLPLHNHQISDVQDLQAVLDGLAGGEVTLTMDGLTDVNLTVSAVQNGQVLTYNNGTWFSGYSVERINGLTDDVYITSPTGAISVATSAAAGEVALDVNWPTLPSGVTAIQTVDGGVLVQWHEPIPQGGPYVVEYQEISSLTAPNITGTSQV